jgi:hypothetical protein
MAPKDAGEDANGDATRDARSPATSDDVDPRAPKALRVLATQFAALEFGLSSLALYHRAPAFDAARLAVESSTQLTFSLAQLRQVLALMPGAYALAWQKRQRGVSRKSNDSDEPTAQWTLTIRKLPLVVDTAEGEQEPASMAERISMFRTKVNVLVEQKVCELQRGGAELEGEALGEAMEHIELEMVPLPDLPTASAATASTGASESSADTREEDDKDAAKDAEVVKSALAAPVPQELQTLPTWLVEKVGLRS